MAAPSGPRVVTHCKDSIGKRNANMNDSDLFHTFAKEHIIRASDLLSLLMPQTSGVGIAVKGLDREYGTGCNSGGGRN